MAARVNVRFVAILCTVVGVVFVGMAGAAYFIVKKSASDHYDAAQAYAQAGNQEEAEKSFAKAVNKERTNVIYLAAWIDSIEELTPETRTKYSDMYWKNYVPALRQLAVAKRTDVEAWEKYLQTQYEQRNVFGASGRSGWQQMLSDTNSALEYFLASPEADNDQAQWHRLRRYRALSNLNMRLGSGQADQDFREKTVLDFEAAMRVDPSDAESAVGLYEWLMAEANEAEGGRTDPQVYLEQARDVLDGFLADNPNHPRALIARLYYDLQVEARPIRELRSQSDRVRANIALAEAFAPRVSAIVDRVLQQSPPEQFNVEVVQLVNRLERLTSPASDIPLTDRMIEATRRASEGNPGRLAQLEFFDAVFSAESNDHERAIPAFEAVMDSPQVAVSLDGIILTLLRGQAVLRRVQSAIDLANQAEDDQKEAARQRVAEYRADVDEYWPEGTPSVMLLDARIAYMKGELAEAQRLAVTYQREANTEDEQVHFLLSAIYMDRNQIGEAVEELKKFVEINPNVPRAWAQLSALQDRIGDKDGARESIDRAAQLAPDDELIQQQYIARLERTGQRESDDPIRQILIQVDRLLDTTGGVSPKYEQAIGIVRLAMARHGDDVRLYNALGTLLGLQQRFDEATETIDEGLAKFPDSQLLQALRTRIRFMADGEIPEGTPPIQRQMLLYRQAMRGGDAEAAQRALDEAIRIDPDYSQVIQVQITRAIEAEDFDRARRLVDRATELNSDQAGGRILRTDLLEAEGRPDEALAMINAVISDGLTSVPVLYRRARIYRGLGRAEDAVADYQEILRRQPDSLNNIREVIAALIALRRDNLALEIARRSQRIAGADPAFLDLWLSLEARLGDSTAAMLRREDVRANQPDNRQNNLALASVYVRLGEWPKARAVIDELRAQGDDIQLVMLDASWHAEQGEMGRAIATFEQYRAQRQAAGTLDVRDVLSYANFLQSRGQSKGSIAMLRESLPLDDAERQPIRRRLALLLLSAGRADEAVAEIDALIASGLDTDGMLQLARVEAYIRGGELDNAQEALDALDATAKASEAAGILRCDLALRRDDRTAALNALSDTLAAHPNSARAYVRRAEIIWTQLQQSEDISAAERAQLRRDASEDLKEAIRQTPGNWEAFRLQGIMAMDAGRYDDAVAAIAKTIELNPAQSSLRDRLVRKLIDEGDTPRAMTIIDSAIEANPADVDLRVHMARLLADKGRSTESIRMFEAALAQRRNPEIAAQFVEFLLGLGTAESRAKARQVLSDPNLNVADTWQLQLMSAGLSMAENNRARAIAQARQSFEMVRNDTSGVVRWFNALPPLIDDHKTRMDIVLQLGAERTPQRVGEIMLASLMLQDPSTEPQGLSELRRLAADSDRVVAFRAGQLLGDTLYSNQDYSGAVEAWSGVIDIDPEAAQSLNNLAYVLATEMGQCEQAIPMALKAIEVGGVAPAIAYSTLTVAYIECNQLDSAQQAAEDLSSAARGTPEETLAVLRQGEVDLALGRIEQARGRLNEARKLLESWGGRAEAYRSILEEFGAALDGR